METALKLAAFNFSYPAPQAGESPRAAAPRAVGESAHATTPHAEAAGAAEPSSNTRALWPEPRNWELPRGAFALLEGATGSGKSTLLRCLVPALAPKGERTGEAVTCGNVAFVAQNPATQMVCDSVLAELAFNLENAGTPAPQMRRRVAEVAHFFGLEPWLATPVANLSGGQQQLLAIATALTTQPALLLLDEPTSQLDPVAAAQIESALFRANKELGVTVLIATHTPERFEKYSPTRFALPSNSYIEEFNFESTSAAPITKGLALSDVFFKYEKHSRWVLQGFDLEVKLGEVHVLMGGNGCGKSTALKLLSGALKPQTGHLTSAFKKSQAYIPQDVRLLFIHDTIVEELGEGTDQRHPFDLSGGQQQLLALRKATRHNPQLLLLDEPARGLDAANKQAVVEALRQLNAQGTTIVLATHDRQLAQQLACRVTLIFNGQAACTLPAADYFAQGE